MNGVIGFTFGSFAIREVVWKCRAEKEAHKASKKKLEMSKHQGADAKMFCSATLLFSCLPGRAPNLPPSPWQQEQVWFLWWTRNNRLHWLPSFKLRWWAAQGCLVGTGCLWLSLSFSFIFPFTTSIPPFLHTSLLQNDQPASN